MRFLNEVVVAGSGKGSSGAIPVMSQNNNSGIVNSGVNALAQYNEELQNLFDLQKDLETKINNTRDYINYYAPRLEQANNKGKKNNRYGWISQGGEFWYGDDAWTSYQDASQKVPQSYLKLQQLEAELNDIKNNRIPKLQAAIDTFNNSPIAQAAYQENLINTLANNSGALNSITQTNYAAGNARYMLWGGIAIVVIVVSGFIIKKLFAAN
jgi:DNA mismatch repair ATPase MutS